MGALDGTPRRSGKDYKATKDKIIINDQYKHFARKQHCIEFQRKQMDIAQVCYACHGPLVGDGRARKRQVPRKCAACRKRAILVRRNKDPLVRMQHRWYNAAHRLWPAAPKALWSAATVKHVYERWARKSVLGGETDPKLLCISYYRHPSLVDGAPELHQLVLVTSKEAQSLARSKADQRHLSFSPAVREAIEPEDENDE